MTAREFVAWRHIMHTMPLDHERTAWGLAIQSCLLANINRDHKRGKAFEPKDFFVSNDLDPPVRKRAQTQEEAMIVLSQLFALNRKPDGHNGQS